MLICVGFYDWLIAMKVLDKYFSLMTVNKWGLQSDRFNGESDQNRLIITDCEV